MPKTIQQTMTFRTSPDTLVDVYLSSRKHTAATGAEAVMSRRVGGRFMVTLDGLSEADLTWRAAPHANTIHTRP